MWANARWGVRVSGRLVLGAVAVVAAYLKGRLDEAVAESLRRMDELPRPERDPYRPAAARTASAAGTPHLTVVPAADAGVHEAAATVAPPAAGTPDTADEAAWDRLVEALRPELLDLTTHDPRVDEVDPGWAAPHRAGATEVQGGPAVLPEWMTGVAPVEPTATGPAHDLRGVLTADGASVHLAEGTFLISGLAVNGGDLAFGRVTFPHRLAHAPDLAQVVLVVDETENLPTGGVAVMADGGFAPCKEGMTLVVAAREPGRFVARGRYRVESRP